MNVKQWRLKGINTIFRHGNIYIVNLTERTVHCTKVDKGNWMRFDDLREFPWTDVSAFAFKPKQLHVQLIAAELIATAKACYCNASVDLCDYCSGRRKLTHSQLNQGTSINNPLTYFFESNTLYAMKYMESDVSQLIYVNGVGTVLDKSLSKKYEYHIFEVDYENGYIGLSGQSQHLDEVQEYYNVQLNPAEVYNTMQQ